MVRKILVSLAMVCVLLAMASAEATHPTSKGMILLGGPFGSFCGTSLPPGYFVHQQDPKLSEQCFTKPSGAMGATVTYSPVRPNSWVGCDDFGDKIRVYGGTLNVFPTLVPTVAQSFTVTWDHSLAGCSTAAV